VEERLDIGDACAHVGVGRGAAALRFPRPRPDAPALALHLVLARLDDEAKQIVSVGERAQLVEADRLVAARPGDEVVAGRKVEAAAGDVGRRDRGERISGPNQSAPVPRAMPAYDS
jgi:hypothetical protein